MNNIMIDIETLGIRVTAPIVSIGACYFDPLTGKIGETYERLLDWREEAYDRRPEPATVSWWLSQSKQARKSILGPPDCTLPRALDELTIFCNEADYIWCTSIQLDIGALENAFESFNIAIPWNFRMLRDARTLMDIAQKLGMKKPPRIGLHHDPLDDAVWQVAAVSKLWKQIFRKK